MRTRFLWLSLCLLSLPLLVPISVGGEEKSAPAITWKKTVIDRTFRAEGVAVADVNKDGKTDVLVGEWWYEAPDWKIHEFCKPRNDKGYDPKSYSPTFGCWAGDFNNDGWADVLVVRYPGEPCFWYENPKGGLGQWKEHQVCHSACNETPVFTDLFGTGQRVLVIGVQPRGAKPEGDLGQMVWLAPGKDPTQPWEIHPISEPSTPEHRIPGTRRYAHGLGAGDVNGDGRLDVMCNAGWWEQPVRLDGKPWKFHPVNFGREAADDKYNLGPADMFTMDIDGDGKADILSSSSHGYGIWVHLQKRGTDNHSTFVRKDLFPHLTSQTHAMHLDDINGDGLKDLVTGKRWWAHGPKGDVDPNAPAKLYWLEAKRGADGAIQFIPHEIDKDSGVGTQFSVGDVNGDKLLDVVTSNKKGVFLFEQVRTR
jgi:hypothetical protein